MSDIAAKSLNQFWIYSLKQIVWTDSSKGIKLTNTSTVFPKSNNTVLEYITN